MVSLLFQELHWTKVRDVGDEVLFNGHSDGVLD